MCVIDDEYAVDGSANLTYAGLWNQINNVHVYDTPEEVLKIKNTFEKIWNYNSSEDNAENASKRDSYYRAKRVRQYYARKRLYSGYRKSESS